LLQGLTLTGGSQYPGGGGIFNEGALTVSQCLITGNGNLLVGSRSGGGIYNSGSLTLRDSTITSNEALGGVTSPSQGAGIANVGSAALTNCTIAGNVTSGNCFGGGIYNNGSMSLTLCTVAGNSATNGARIGGVYNQNTMNVSGTIIAGNTTSLLSPDVSGTFASGGYNLIATTNGSTGFGARGDQLGSTNAPINALLGPLADNGGPTPTVSPLVNSPAVDKGSSFGLTTDQRGAPRPFDFSSITNAGGDGSDIGAFELGSPRLGIVWQPPNAVISWPAYYGDFQLESVAALAASNHWTSVTNTVSNDGSMNRVTIPASNGNEFYRLKR
jgi:hypothetical protein